MSARTDVARLASKSGDTSDDFKLDSLPGVDPDIFAEWKYAWELFAGTTDNAIDDAKFDLLLNSVGCDGDLDSLTLPGVIGQGIYKKNIVVLSWALRIADIRLKNLYYLWIII